MQVPEHTFNPKMNVLISTFSFVLHRNHFCLFAASYYCDTNACNGPPIITGHSDFCTENRKCGHHEGDCDNDSECQSGLRCGIDNCPTSLGFDSNTDCCYKEFIGTYDMKDANGVAYYKDTKTNNIIWHDNCNEWRISNDINHKGQCNKGEPLNFKEGDISQNCIMEQNDDIEEKYGSDVFSGYIVDCKKVQSKSWIRS